MEKIVKVKCQFCGDEIKVDFNKLEVDVQAVVEFYLKKFGIGSMECEACKKAIAGWQLRTGTCHYCTKLARYDGDENFVECFGCGRKGDKK